MLMVLAVHIDGASLGLPNLHGNISALDSRTAWQLIVESLAIVGVNCFTLISGYFSIRLRVRSIVSYLFQCCFYAVGIYTFFLIYQPLKFTWTGWLESFLVLSHTDLWYVPTYFGLMLLSPFLNLATESLSRKKFGILLSAFIIFNVWCGWLWGESFNPTGYTLVQLIMVYLTGRYLKLHTVETKGNKTTVKMLIAYLLAATAVFASSIYMQPKAFAYNSPFVLIESVALFMAFRSMSFNSNLINYAAKSAFAVYLLHKAPAIFGDIMKPAVVGMWHSCDLLQFSAFSAVLMAMTYTFAMIVDTIRRYIDVKICKLFKV